jgi:hypothetical protein
MKKRLRLRASGNGLFVIRGLKPAFLPNRNEGGLEPQLAKTKVRRRINNFLRARPQRLSPFVV